MAGLKRAAFICRVQPKHIAHHEIIKHTLNKYDQVIVLIGSAKQARSPKNPFTAEEREQLIRCDLTADENKRVVTVPLRDYLYNDNQWLMDVQRKVADIVEESGGGGTVSIVGRLKDRTSYYMRMFPQWPCDEYIAQHPQDATKVRRALFDGRLDEVEASVTKPVYGWLREWMKTDTYAWVLEEDRFIENYKNQFKNAKGDYWPFPPTFVTVDAVVVQAGHVLMVRRRGSPGKGLFALPGGFLNQFEFIEDGMLRELKEETKLQVPKEVLKGSIVAQRVFDHPDRSLRGRTITHGFCIHLRDGELIDVKGGDDADKAMWIPLADLNDIEHQTFEDHIHMIRYFANRF